MNKDELEIIKKIKEVMISFQSASSHGLSSYDIDNKAISFGIIETENKKTITLVNDYKYSKLEPIKNDKVFEIIEDYFKNGGKQLEVKISGKMRTNSLVNIILRKQPTDEFLDMLMSSFFRNRNNHLYEDSLIKINKHIKEKNSNKDYCHLLAFKILSQIGKEGQVITNQDYFYSSSFPSICHQLSKFKIDEKDYPVLHNMFNYFSEPIKNEITCRNASIELLKSSVSSRDWGIFKEYWNDEKIKKPQSVDMFDEKHNPKFHLNINGDFVTKQYPAVSLSNDYINMISSLVSQIKDFKEILGLESCQIISQSNNVTSIYFLSKDEKPVDGEKIKKIFSSMIEIYEEMLGNKEKITKDTLGLAMRANILAIDLDRNCKEENKPARKTNKI